MAEEVQSEQENKKIDAHMALANKVYAIRSPANKNYHEQDQGYCMLSGTGFLNI